eukprot:1734281-Ditylum_brightwellii.AAC.1
MEGQIRVMGGIGFTHVHASQLSAKWAQLSAGTAFPILEETSDLVYLEGKWLRPMLQDMREIKCKMHLRHTWTPQPQREHDTCIMDVVINNPCVEIAALEVINWCRLYRRDFFVSDI